MTNPETKAQYEGAILNQLVKNAEKLSVIEFKFGQIEPKIDNLDERLDNLDEHIDNLGKRLDNLDDRLSEIEKLLGWLRWIGGGVVAIALSLIANFVYSFLN